MAGDPLALYRMPRASQVATLAYLRYQAQPEPVAELDGAGFVRVGTADDLLELDPGAPRDYHNPDPTQGARMPRPVGVQAVSAEARERADRFRVA
jgi:hypothetical protein